MSEATRAAVYGALAAGRVAFGAAMLLRPAQTLAALRHDPAEISSTATLMARMYGVRDVALGSFAIAVRSDREGASTALLATAVVDIGDAAALATLLSSRRTRHLAFEGMAMALPIAVTAVWLRSRLER